MRELTPELVKRVWAEMSNKYDAEVYYKPTSSSMSALGSFLSICGIINKDSFIKKYATTIGRSIYLPYRVGTPTTSWGLWEQIKNAAHEFLHVHKYVNAPFGYSYSYITDTRYRAAVEAQCYATAIELSIWANKPCPSVNELAMKLRDYGCNTSDISFAEEILTETYTRLKTYPNSVPATFSVTSRAIVPMLE